MQAETDDTYTNNLQGYLSYKNTQKWLVMKPCSFSPRRKISTKRFLVKNFSAKPNAGKKGKALNFESAFVSGWSTGFRFSCY